MFATGGFSARDLQLDPASPLARLVQDVVRRDQNHFAEAIRAVQAWLSDNADTVVAKPLHRYLGNILSYMFLHSQETGGPMILRADISSQLASSVFDFLRPQTIFLRTLLNLHGRSQLYEVYFDQLPAPTRRLISNMDFTQLPSVYQQRIKGIQPTDGPNALLAGQTRPPPPRQFGAGHLQVSPTKDGSRSTIKIMFNMFEYYIYCFALCAIQTPPTGPGAATDGSHAAHHRTLGLHLRWGDKNRQLSRDQSSGNTLYLKLVRQYMQYFVPKPGASQSTHRNDDMHSHTDTLSGSYKRGVEVGREAVKDITNITHGFSRAVDSLWKHKQAPQDGSRQRSDFAGSEDNILALSHPDQQQRINACYFVIGTFIEVWLCQNDRLSFASPTKAGPSSLSGYIKPTEAQIGAVSLLVGYVVPSHPREYKGDQRFMDGKLTSNAFSVMQPKLYWFLKLAIEYWPKEDTFASVIDIWLTFITPWRKDSKDAKFSTEWLAYVQDNFMFYTCLLDTFLRRTRNFDIYGSVRPIQTEHAASKTYNNSHLVMTEKVLEAFDDPLLVSVLSSIESALFAFDSQGNRLGATRARRGTSSEQAASAGWNSDSLMLQRLGSTGDESRLKLQSLGEKIGRPVFVLRRAYEGQAQRQSTSSITDLVGMLWDNLQGSRIRLQNILDAGCNTHAPPPNVPPTPGRGVPPPSFLELGSRRTSSSTRPKMRIPVWPSALDYRSAEAYWQILQWTLVLLVNIAYVTASLGVSAAEKLKQDANEPKQSLPTETANKDIIRRNVSRIDDCLGAIKAIWRDQLALPNEGLRAAESPFFSPSGSRRPSVSRSGVYSQEVVFKTVAPGVLAPEERLSRDGIPVLTSRGREQLKNGTRMCSKEDIPILPTDKAKAIVMSYESRLLVWFWETVATWLDHQYANLRQVRPDLPELPSFQWLRHFAAPRNIIFWIFFICSAYYTLKIMGAFFRVLFSGDGGQTKVVRRVATHRPSSPAVGKHFAGSRKGR